MRKQPSERIREELAQANDRFDRAVARARQGEDSAISVALDGDLGQVVLDARGRLIDVRLDADQLGFTSGRSLGTAVVRAVAKGEQQARQLREGRTP